MPLVSRKCIEDIKDRIDITDVVSPYVSLKRSGAHWKGLSPFTSEKTPSFYVMPEKGIFKCFSSGYAGDIFRFLQLKENLSFQEAIESLAHRNNITLEYEEGSQGNQKSVSLKKELLEINELAAYFFHQHLLADNPKAEVIRQYWQENRKFTLDVAKEFKVGYAVPEKFALVEYLLKKRRFSQEALEQCGLFYVRERSPINQRYVSRFRGRLTIPVRDVQGRVIAFACRKLEQTPEDDPAFEAKYINSPETPIFNKSRTLFGLERARKYTEEAGYFVMVEGQLDAIRCWTCEINTTIAPQGTAITEQQLSTLRRYTTKVYCILDGDSAGQKAALRIIPLCLKADLDIQFVPLDPKEDPDTLLSNQGAEALTSRFPQALSLVEFSTKAILSDNPSPQEKNKALKELYDLLLLCGSSVAQEEYLLELARITHTNRQNIESDFARYKKSKSSNAHRKKDSVTSDQENEKDKLTSAEYQLLLVVLNHEDIAHSLSHIVDPLWIDQDAVEGTLLIKILAEIREDLWTGQQHIHELLENDEERNFIYTVLGEDPPYEEPLITANLILKNLYQRYLNKEKTRLEHDIANISPENFDKIRLLQKERMQIRTLMNKPPHLPELPLTPA